MNPVKTIATQWYPEEEMIITRLSGDVDEAGIDQWERSWQTAMAGLADDSRFKILVDLHGFKAANLEVHKKFRTIIPQTLAAYGWKVGYVDLFEEESKSMIYTNHRGIACYKAAHCHHDATKMELYETNCSRGNEHFFTDPGLAKAWLTSS